MKARRARGLVLAGMASAAVGLIVACTFPEATFTPDDVGSLPGDENTNVDAAAEADLDAPIGNDVFVLIDGGDPDALIVKDAGTKIDASGCTTCDCDDDDFLDTSKAGCNAADAGPKDCDDSDSRYRPNQEWLLDKPTAPQTGDWNCSGKIEKFYDKTNVTCTGAGGSACDAKFGFTDDPKCGETGTFVKCHTVGAILGVLLGSCVIDSQSIEKQACK